MQHAMNIHQIWIGEIPDRERSWMDSIRQWAKRDGHHYRLWREEDCDEILRRYDFRTDLRGSFPPFIYKSDIARLCLLHEYGGLYLDADFISVEDRGCAEYLEDIPGLGLLQHRDDDIINCLMWSGKPHSPVLEHILERLKENLDGESLPSPMTATGPGFLTRLVFGEDRLITRVTLLPRARFMPVNSWQESFGMIGDAWFVYLFRRSWQVPSPQPTV